MIQATDKKVGAVLVVGGDLELDPARPRPGDDRGLRDAADRPPVLGRVLRSG